MSDSIFQSIFDYFASDPIGPMLTLPQVAQDDGHPLASDLRLQLESYSDSAVALAKADSSFRALGRNFDSSGERAARIWLLLQSLHTEIPRARLRILSAGTNAVSCCPYDQSALTGIKLSRHMLVPLTEFRVYGSRLVRGDHAFTIVSPLQSPNSQHWLLQALTQSGIANQASVRLDPLLHRLASDFTPLEYRMLWYGKDLDWERILHLRAEEHGRWLPGPLSTRAQFIDFVWSPRADGIHFRCEEIPASEEVGERGSRYLHAILDPSGEYISHLDGSIRIYSPIELQQRIRSHLRKCGKVGNRIKVFSVSGQVEKEAMVTVCIGYYVWSFDVARYFGVDVPDEL